MAKCLSELERKILEIAYKSFMVRSEYPIDTSLREILVILYGFQSNVDLTRRKAPALVFDCNRIGLKRYHAGYVATSKSFNRLIMRRLATKRFGQGFRCGRGIGIKLTREGIRTAEGIRQEMFRAKRQGGELLDKINSEVTI